MVSSQIAETLIDLRLKDTVLSTHQHVSSLAIFHHNQQNIPIDVICTTLIKTAASIYIGLSRAKYSPFDF
tara:strand:+ start:164 stop:373 length:210 start_codon:yes stop_codon:yes gene_type:complete